MGEWESRLNIIIIQGITIQHLKWVSKTTNFNVNKQQNNIEGKKLTAEWYIQYNSIYAKLYNI